MPVTSGSTMGHLTSDRTGRRLLQGGLRRRSDFEMGRGPTSHMIITISAVVRAQHFEVDNDTIIGDRRTQGNRVHRPLRARVDSPPPRDGARSARRSRCRHRRDPAVARSGTFFRDLTGWSSRSAARRQSRATPVTIDSLFSLDQRLSAARALRLRDQVLRCRVNVAEAPTERAGDRIGSGPAKEYANRVTSTATCSRSGRLASRTKARVRDRHRGRFVVLGEGLEDERPR